MATANAPAITTNYSPSPSPGLGWIDEQIDAPRCEQAGESRSKHIQNDRSDQRDRTQYG